MASARFRWNANPAWIVCIAWAVGIGVLGVAMVHHPMILSGFARIQTDLGDSRLNHYLLEHGYRWVRGEAGHQDLWSPPFFYPAENAAAHSDLLLGVGPVYWLWRILGAAPDRAFALWMVSMSVLNYAAGLLVFGRGLGFGLPAAVGGAALVAFGAPRVNQLGHQQLLPCFYVLLAVYALARLAGDRSLGRPARAAHWLLAVAAGVAQLYSGVYLGWFLILGLGLATAAALALGSCRRVVLGLLWQDLGAIVVAGTLGLLCLQPFLSHYLRTARQVNTQYLPTLRGLHPQFWSWWNLGRGSWLWGWTADRGPFRGQPFLAEHLLGIGFLTPWFCVLGLYLGRDRPICRLAALVALIVWIATTFLPGDPITMLAAGVSVYAAAGLFHDSGDPRSRGIALAVLLGWLFLVRFPNPYLERLGLTAMILCWLEIGRRRGDPQAQIVPGIALVALGLKFFALPVIPTGVMLVASVAGLLAYYLRSHWWEIGFGAIGGLLLFGSVMTFLDRPAVLTGVLVAFPLAMALSAPRRFRPPGWLLLRGLLIALPLLTFFYHRDSLWLGYSGMIPGSIAIRAVGRVVLILLIPMALGLATLVEYLDRSRWALAGGILALVCLAEQGITTETFDAAANRATIAGIARQVDRGRVAFYYHPCDEQPFYRYHLDAMWASLATGVPTINGYSGYAPREWEGFFALDADSKIAVEDVLSDWEHAHGLVPDRVQWIGADCPRQGRARSAAVPPRTAGPRAVAGD
jgi:hypothetical protein